MNPLYKKAQKDESFRQEFLNQFLKKYSNKAVSKLIYNKDNQGIKEFIKKLVGTDQIDKASIKNIEKSLKPDSGIEIYAFCPRGFIGKGMSVPIFVEPNCFKLDFNYFISVIVDHEYVHAKHVKNGIKLKEGLEISYLNQSYFNPEVLLLIDEYLAYKNQKRFKEDLEEIKKQLKNIKKFESTSEEAVVKFLITTFK